MSRATSLLLSGILALSFAVATPALALNPQPLPPGAHAPGGGGHKLSAYVTGRQIQTFQCRSAMCRR
jgi:hypothetical protein